MLLLLAGISLLTACATHRLHTRIEATPSYALPPADSGVLYQLAERVTKTTAPNASTFLLLPNNLESLRWRLLLADLAKESIDVQYYLIDKDESSQLFTLHLIRAAERGVRVRLLIDDVFLMNRDKRIALWNEHPNIEIRVFNPWHKRGSLFQQGLEFLGYSERLNQRMHNKLFVVDNLVGIMGGRNIGNAYFGLSEKYNFRELGAVVAGPVVTRISDSFDLYWNDDWTVSAAAFAGSGDDLESRTAVLQTGVAKLDASEKLRQAGLDEPVPVNAYLERFAGSSTSGQAWAVYDDPPSDVLADAGVRKIEKLEDIDSHISRELLIASPYFIPSEILLEKLQGLTERGVRVRVLTNSLASTNHTMVHSGYRPWRRKLLDAGIELYEYRSDATDTDDVLVPGIRSRFLALHTKTFVIDREFVYVGSLNMDPRSFHLNTEMGLLVASPALAEQVAEQVEQDMEPENAWHVTLDKENRFVWSSSAGTVHMQPARNFGQRIADFFYGLLPIKDQL